jgi:hypothetical protein
MTRSNSSNNSSQSRSDADLPEPLGWPGTVPPPPPQFDPSGGTFVKDYEGHSVQAQLEALDSAQNPKVPNLDPETQQRADELRDLEKPDQKRLWVASRDSLNWSVLYMLPPKWQKLTAEMQYLDRQNEWHPTNMYLTDLLREERYQEWIQTSRVWMIAVQPFLPGQPATPILVASQVPPSPGDHLSLVSIHTFWEHTPEGEEVEPECSMTVLWPAFRLSQDDLAAVALGAIEDNGLFVVLDGSRLALAPKESEKP